MLDQLDKAHHHLGRSGAPTMHCARCDSFAEVTAEFCTACGAQLRPIDADSDPIQVGAWAVAASQAAPGSDVVDDVTVPIRGSDAPPRDTDSEPDPVAIPEGPRPAPEQLPRRVADMGEREKEAWLDDVWGVPDDRADSGSVGH